MNGCYELPHVMSSNLDFKELDKQLQMSYDIDAFEVLSDEYEQYFWAVIP
jgi:hypothetical protein